MTATSASSAFGGPGIAPTFAAGDKDVVSTTLGTSRVWITVGGGVLNELFWPNTGRPQLRDLGFLVTGTGFWTEVKRVAEYTVTTPDPAVPLPTIVHHHERYRLTLRIVGDPDRDAVLVEYDLADLTPGGDPALALHVLAAPHLGGSGHDNDGWVADGVLYAQRADEALAIVATPPFSATSAGYVGASDGWQDVAAHGVPQWRFTEARHGNVALTGTCAALQGCLALAFASTGNGARSLAVAAGAQGFAATAERVEQEWRAWGADLPFATDGDVLTQLARTSAMVLRVHEDRTFPGAIVASLSTPWGMAHDDPGGYHLVWPRDCAETALALAAVGRTDDARRVLLFLAANQSPDGHWPQNFTPDGTAYWSGLQLDETALPVILACRLRELGVIDGSEPIVREMVRRASAYLVVHGPLTDEDRWEETAGANPFTLAACVAALAGAAHADLLSTDEAAYALSLAEWWNDRVDDLLYVAGTEIDAAFATAGHFVRVAPPSTPAASGRILLANRNGEQIEVARLVGLEFLALVRYGLRAALDPRVVDTVTIVDGTLRTDTLPDGTAVGPLYHRYQEDGYGEHEDGNPFDGSGIGRLWPLLAGERGHYALDAGADPLPYLRAMAGSVSPGGLLPEQVWDAAAIPVKRLAPGRATGSAMPLVWAHAEFLKLYLAHTTGVRADRLRSVAEHFATRPVPARAHLRTEPEVTTAASELCIEATEPFTVRFGTDDWQHATERTSMPTVFGLHTVVVRRGELGAATTLDWTRLDQATDTWEGVDHHAHLS